jgi:5'-hydroxyaverantin dehydrogenase
VAQKNLFEMAADTKPSVDTAPPAPGFSVVEVNLKGVYYSCYLAMHYFQLPRTVNNTFQKSIVLIASLSAYTGYKLSSTYSISKFGVRGLFYSIREAGAALSPSVRVNLVAPTFLDTPMVTGAGMIDHPVVKLIGIVPMRPVVDVIMRVAADESVQGRAVACMADGSKDLGDELRTGFAGAEAQKLVVGAMAEGMKKMIVEAQGQAA